MNLPASLVSAIVVGLSWLLWAGAVVLCAWVLLSLLLEGERRAPARFATLAIPGLAVWSAGLVFGPFPVQAGLAAVAVAVLGTGGWLVWKGSRAAVRGSRAAVRGDRTGTRGGRGSAGPTPETGGLPELGLGRRERRVDERDTVFARMSYTPAGAAFEDYYSRNPDRREADDALRALPELCGPGSVTYHEINSRIAPAIFGLLEGWHGQAEMGGGRRAGADGDSEPVRRIEVSTGAEREAMTRKVKGLARYYGAVACGVTELDPAFVYTHVGRREKEYGREVRLEHRYAIVFAVEMDYAFVAATPALPVVVESSRLYLEAAKVGLAVAANIRNLGWPARVHMDGDYLAVLPPLAVRAGLGEIGRLGLLVTEDFGPRVRLGLVTTDLPLIADAPRPFGLQAFCRLCAKCAANCPGQAIDRAPQAGGTGWGIKWENCYRFWRRTGTDCAMCLASCPYSKPGSSLHRLVRVAVRGSEAARRLALSLDDFLYGRRPRRRHQPDWFHP